MRVCNDAIRNGVSQSRKQRVRLWDDGTCRIEGGSRKASSVAKKGMEMCVIGVGRIESRSVSLVERWLRSRMVLDSTAVTDAEVVEASFVFSLPQWQIRYQI